MARTLGKGLKGQPLRRYALAIGLAGLFGVLLLQTSPRLREQVDPVRAAAADQLTGPTGSGWLSRLTGQATRDDRIAALEDEIRELERYRQVAISMAARLETYEDILNAMGEPPLRGITARVIAETNGPFAEALLANAGRAQGVDPGAYAENEGGLVGRVVQLGEHSSRIMMVTDFNSRIPVMGEASGLRAIMFGGRDGTGRLTARPERGTFIPGERILTSGEGGIFPRGVIIGTVAEMDGDIRVRLGMHQGRGGFVRLMPAVDIPKPEPMPEAPREGTEEAETAATEPAEAGQAGQP